MHSERAGDNRDAIKIKITIIMTFTSTQLAQSGPEEWLTSQRGTGSPWDGTLALQE